MQTYLCRYMLGAEGKQKKRSKENQKIRHKETPLPAFRVPTFLISYYVIHFSIISLSPTLSRGRGSYSP